MKRSLMLMMALVVLLSGSVASADEGLTAYVFNSNDERRVVTVYVSTSSGAVAMPVREIAPKSSVLFDFFGHDSESQKWNFHIASPRGYKISEASITYDDGKFSPCEIGVGIVYTNYVDKEVRLELTK